MQSRHPSVESRPAPLLWVALVLTVPVGAQSLAEQEIRLMPAPDREVVVLPTATAAATDTIPASATAAGVSGPVGARSWETASQRIHEVNFEGETFRASTPLDGPWSRIVFDPSRRSFTPLLPSIRVELSASVQLDAIAEVAGAVGVTSFESLGFAFLELPANMHPAEALARLEALPQPPQASLRLRSPGVEWR